MFACLLLIVVPKPNIGNGRPHPPITTPLHPSLSVHMPIRDPNQCCVADNNNNKKKLNRKNRREGFGYNKKKTRDSEIGDRPLFITAKAFPLLSFLFVARLFVISTSAFTKKCVSSFFMCLRASHDRIMPLFVVRAFLCAFFFYYYSSPPFVHVFYIFFMTSIKYRIWVIEIAFAADDTQFPGHISAPPTHTNIARCLTKRERRNINSRTSERMKNRSA